MRIRADAASRSKDASADPGAASQLEAILTAANGAAREIADRTRAARAHGNALTVLAALQELFTEYSEREEVARRILAAELAVASARVGNIADAHRYGDLGYVPEANPEPAPEETPSQSDLRRQLAGFRPQNALAVLKRIARRQQVVMINEAHHVPQHRAFTLLLLGALRQLGYGYFAAEALDERDADLQQRGFATAKSGTYLSEPLYGELVRSAIRLGYRVVAYEDRSAAGIEARERGQARHLHERILRGDPAAKILIHAGYSHIDEAGTRAGVVPMAQCFRELTGIDPFTVDQVTMTEHGSVELEHPGYLLAEEEGWLRQPTLLMKRGATFSASPGKHDATLFQPRSSLEQGRPSWLGLAGARHAVPVPAALRSEGRRLLVSARRAEEPAEAIPVDQLVVESREAPAFLRLPPGSYLVQAEDVAGAFCGCIALAISDGVGLLS